MNISDQNSCLSGFNTEIYDRFSVPIYFEPYAQDLVGRIDLSAVKSALEIACGTGVVTRHLRKAMMPESILVATDISNDMLEYARKKLQGEKIEWMIADGSQLPFEDKSFDLVICEFGFMFVPDKLKAFREAYRVLRPGGSLLFNTWDKLELNEAQRIGRHLFREFFGELPPESLLPFSMNDHNEIRSLLSAAGFTDLTIETVSKKAIANSAMDAAISAAKGGLMYNEIMKRNPGALPEFLETLFKELSTSFGEAPMIAPMRAIVSQGWKRKGN